eukprot:1677612-Pyramimonas_sp.AAC.1
MRANFLKTVVAFVSAIASVAAFVDDTFAVVAAVVVVVHLFAAGHRECAVALSPRRGLHSP